MLLFSFLLAALVPLCAHCAGGAADDPVLAGYDLVAYHSLEPHQDGIPGSAEISHRHDDGYLYYFSSQANLEAFKADPERYLPQYGGFCAWGVAWEYENDGWPWKANHMGPPCGPRDGWALLEGPDGVTRLYCSIWRSYQDDFNNKQEEGIRLANQRWVEWYGSLSDGPKNNGCYAWNWQECFAKSIYNPENPLVGTPEEQQAQEVTLAPTPASTEALFDEEQVGVIEAVWSEEQTALEGAVAWKWSLQNVTTVRPLLLVELTYNLDEEFSSLANQYVGFGVAEQVMQGALVVCYPQLAATTEDTVPQVAKQEAGSGNIQHNTICKTFLGTGMGISEPASDPVQPSVLFSELSDRQYRIRFSANLFACWSNPQWPARLLFSRGLVSGNGDPMPHINNGRHRQAVPGVDLLSVVSYTNRTFVDSNATVESGPPPPKTLEPLPTGPVTPVPGTAGSLEILQGRVTVVYEILEYGDDQEEVVQVKLQNVPFDLENEDEHHYIGFGFALDTMSGLIMTCSPRWDADTEEFTTVCHQWRGLGTNLYPPSLGTDAGGWFLDGVENNSTHLNFTLVGRTADVMAQEDDAEDASQFRAICALGRAAPDSGTPLMHSSSNDRTPMILDKLAVAASRRASEAQAVRSSGMVSSPVWLGIALATMVVLLGF